MNYRKLIIAITLITIAAFFVGCKTSGGGGKKGLKVTGPDASHIHGDWNRQTQQLGYNPKGKKIVQKHSETSGKNSIGPYTCRAGEGCWHGIARHQGNTYLLEWPQTRSRWVVSHETLHAVDFATGAGDHSTNLTPGHPEFFVAKDGRRIRAKSLVGGRWPAKVAQSFKNILPGGNTPQDPWKNQWEDVDCGVESTRARHWERGVEKKNETKRGK